MNIDNLIIYLLLIALPIFLFFVSFMLGRYPVAPIDVVKTILSPIFPQLAVSPELNSIVFTIRLPRIIAALLVGAALSIAGASFQGIFKNPLVSPDLLGVSMGAGFGAAVAILANAGNALIQLSAFIFGIISVSITYGISKAYKAGGILLLVLSGTAVSAFFNALISGTKFMADPYDKLPQITYWLMGSLSAVNFDKLSMIIIPLLIGILVILVLRWHLNVLAMGDEEAQSLGLDAGKLRLLIIVACTLVTSAAVSISGIIGWVGLVVPHMTRIIVGPDHKILLPASLSIGASFLLLIDNISRTFISIEIPIGILTAIVGVPLFLYLLRRGYSEWS
ncbi:MAG: iron ABC transporter permease [Methanobrevibacter sp.]|nr:iron ABC transporter permease [Methanobrevibacter sp.]MBO5965884.1 iron ABC transporter permease [Methanobrevibacter sp.]MBO6104360.1 iron ABC transporter permease [Methanobrevibacter sp.]MBO7158712.1 iron ABC transporter permease [Methanobrevibacter sp.]MBP5699513.1 iron ABC transporter permease [Methanobrevibacter sp.]